MNTREEIYNELKSVSDGLDLTGNNIEALLQLLTQSVYRNQYNVTSIAYEARQSKCVYINSAIVHAREKTYSVFRGNNQRIRIQRISPQSVFTVEAFDTALEIGGFKLLYANNYSFQENVIIDIELIVAKKDVQIKEKSPTSANLTYIDFLNADISEDIILYKDGLSVGTTKKFRELVGKDFTDFYVMTNVDYSISVLQSNSFEITNIVKLKYIEYNEDRLEPSSVKQVPNFRFIPGTTTVVAKQELVRRESNPQSIYMKSNIYYVSGFIVKTNDDLPNVIREFFPQITGLNYQFVTVNEEGEVKEVIQVYYITRTGEGIPETSVIEFNDYIENAFYISQEVRFQYAYSEVYEASLVLHASSQIQASQVAGIINDYCTMIGGTFIIYEILARLQTLTGVSYAEIVSTTSFKLELGADKYVAPTSISVGYETT